MIYMYRKQCFLLSIHLIKGWWTQQHAYIYGTVYLAWIKDKSRRTWLVSLYRKAKRLAPNIILVSENLLNIQSKLAVHCLVNKCSRGILSLLESLHPYRTDTLRFVLATLEFEFSSTTNIYMYTARMRRWCNFDSCIFHLQLQLQFAYIRH